MTEIASELENMPELVIVSGMSGAGRTEAMHAFEDLGYFCVDNLPSALIGNLLALTGMPGQPDNHRRIAVVCDARSGGFFKSLMEELSKLYVVRKQAHHVINTTDMMPAQLRSTIRALFAPGEERQGLQVTVYSFGFKHGAPVDADLVMDVRFLPNPYYDPELRPLTGLDKPVRDYVLCRSETEEFQKCWRALLDCVMPGYVAEGKQQLAIAVGCTGGQHRSVALAESTGEYLKQKGYRVSVAHRDLKLAEGADGQLINASAKPVEGR